VTRSNGIDERRNGGLVGDVGPLSLKPRSMGAGGSLQGIELFLAAIRHRHSSFFRQKRQAHRLAEAARAPRDQHCLT